MIRSPSAPEYIYYVHIVCAHQCKQEVDCLLGSWLRIVTENTVKEKQQCWKGRAGIYFLGLMAKCKPLLCIIKRSTKMGRRVYGAQEMFDPWGNLHTLIQPCIFLQIKTVGWSCVIGIKMIWSIIPHIKGLVRVWKKRGMMVSFHFS